MQEDARSSLVRAKVPKRNDLLVVNQSKKDGSSPNKELLSQLKKQSQIQKMEDLECGRV